MKENLPHPNHKAGEGRPDGNQDHGTMYKKQFYKVINYTYQLYKS